MRRILFIYPAFAMHFDILRLRHQGKPFTRDQVDNAAYLRGDVHIRWEQRSTMGRPSLIAEAISIQADKRSQATPLWPPLLDAHIHSMATHGMVITGTEIIDGVAYAQSWHCRVV